MSVIDKIKVSNTEYDVKDSSVQDFARNSSSPLANITSSDIANWNGKIDKDANNLTNYELKTSTGNAIELTIDSSTYVMTINLKNSAGTTISTGTIDLPLETMVVGATYDNVNKKIILSLKNGQTIDVPVGDLVSGLASQSDLNAEIQARQTADTNLQNQINAKQDIMQYSTMPTADSSNVGKIIEYVGTTGTYTNGYFYKNVHTEIQESITAEETDNLGLLDDINVNATTFKSKVNGGGTYKFVKKGYPTKATFMNITAFPPTTYSITRDSIFDNTLLGQYSWVDDSNNYYVTDTLRPNAGTKLYSYNINTEETTDTGASYLNSSEPSTTSGYWTIQTSTNVYEDANLSEYGITMSTNGFPGNEITVTWIQASDSYNWQQINVQPAGGVSIDYFTIVDGKLNIIYEGGE